MCKETNITAWDEGLGQSLEGRGVSRRSRQEKAHADLPTMLGEPQEWGRGALGYLGWVLVGE